MYSLWKKTASMFSKINPCLLRFIQKCRLLFFLLKLQKKLFCPSNTAFDFRARLRFPRVTRMPPRQACGVSHWPLLPQESSSCTPIKSWNRLLSISVMYEIYRMFYFIIAKVISFYCTKQGANRALFLYVIIMLLCCYQQEILLLYEL
jgi:hypothetical protein